MRMRATAMSIHPMMAAGWNIKIQVTMRMMRMAAREEQGR
jgi:hypothetical protein